MKLKKSFTLIETLVVLMIVFILSLVGVTTYNNYLNTTKENSSNYSNSVNNRVAAIDNMFPSEEEKLQKLYEERREKYKDLDLDIWRGAMTYLRKTDLSQLSFKFPSLEESNKYKELLEEAFNGRFEKSSSQKNVYHLTFSEVVVFKEVTNSVVRDYWKNTINDYFGLK